MRHIEQRRERVLDGVIREAEPCRAGIAQAVQRQGRRPCELRAGGIIGRVGQQCLGGLDDRVDQSYNFV